MAMGVPVTPAEALAAGRVEAVATPLDRGDRGRAWAWNNTVLGERTASPCRVLFMVART
jgi:hypothetical protein